MENAIKVLFFAETVTLAHAMRPAVLAGLLSEQGYDVHFAWDDRYKSLFPNLKCRFHAIDSVSPKDFMQALADGKPLYSADTLEGYVLKDLDIIEQVAPDVIIGDFRLSLSVSARLAKIPYLALSNIYWSPYYHSRYPVPENIMVDVFGVRLAQAVFNLIRPVAFAYHCRPLNKVRKHFGLNSLGYDLRNIYTDADLTLYSDVAEMFDVDDLPVSHKFLGPVLWSPKTVKPQWWCDIPADKPIVYVCLGSSGAVNLLINVIDFLSKLPVMVLVSTAGRVNLDRQHANVFVADFLPGDEVCEIADLVICNGGSPTTQQALSKGAPILGLASNLDQHLNMLAMENAGVGVRMRTENFDGKTFLNKVHSILNAPEFQLRAKSISKIFQQYDLAENCDKAIRCSL